jgi:hypothetical protein
MKKLYIYLSLISFISINAQSLEDTKDFLINEINSNPPQKNYTYSLYFKDNITPSDANLYSNKKLTNDEYENLFFFIYEISNNSGGYGISRGFFLDIRDISKVTTTQIFSENYNKLTLYIENKYYAKEFTETMSTDAKWEYFSKFEIFISGDFSNLQKVKKALIHLGSLKGKSVKDGDVF